jgi:hypothetical protein
MYVIKLPANRFKTVAAEPQFAEYIGVADIDGVCFPTNAYPKLFASKEAAEKYRTSRQCIYLNESTVEEYDARR